MLIAIGVVLGLVLGGWLVCIGGLRKARGVGPVLILVGFALLPIAYYETAEVLDRPTPGSAARSADLMTAPADGALLAVTIAVTAAVVVTTLVRVGVARRIATWAGSSGQP